MMLFTIDMDIHTVRLDIITTIEQHRRDTITIDHLRRRDITDIMAIAIILAISIDLIAINRSIIINLPQQEDADKKYNEI